MKKTTDILSGVIAFGITIGLLAVPIYFLRWYEIIVIHLICFLISFILSKAVTSRSFKDPQSVFIATLVFGMAGLFLNLFEWKKDKREIEGESEIDFKCTDEESELFVEFAKKIISEEENLAVKMICKNTGLYRCLEKDINTEFGKALSKDEIRKFLNNKASDDEIKEIIESSYSFFLGDWESIGVGGITGVYGAKMISDYNKQAKKLSINSFSDWIIKPFLKDSSLIDPKKFLLLNNANRLYLSYKKDNIEIEPVYFDTAQSKECYLFWDNYRALRENYTEPYNNFKFEHQVLKPLLKIWENSSKEDYKIQSYNIWKEFLINEVIKKDNLNSDYEKAFKESNLEFIQSDDFNGSYLNFSQEGYRYMNSGFENEFYGVNLHFSWDQEHDELGYDQDWSSFGGVPISWNGLVANLPNYYDQDFVNGQTSLGEAKTLDEACKILSELPIADYNKLTEEEKEDISYIKFPHKDDKIQETESKVELNTDLPENWGNDSIIATKQIKFENESLQESAKAERVKSFCTNCGESISAGDKSCGSCGTKTN